MDIEFNLDVRVLALGIAAILACVLLICRTAVYTVDEARKAMRYMCGENESPKQ